MTFHLIIIVIIIYGQMWNLYKFNGIYWQAQVTINAALNILKTSTIGYIKYL